MTSNYSITVRTFKGHAGETCFQGSVLLDGKKIGEWSEDASGGEMWLQCKTLEDEEKFRAWANAQPPAVEFEREMRGEREPTRHRDNTEITVAHMVDKIREDKVLRRWCKTKTVVATPGAAKGTFMTLDRTYHPSQDALILSKYPGAEIINKRFG